MNSIRGLNRNSIGPRANHGNLPSKKTNKMGLAKKALLVTSLTTLTSCVATSWDQVSHRKVGWLERVLPIDIVTTPAADAAGWYKSMPNRNPPVAVIAFFLGIIESPISYFRKVVEGTTPHFASLTKEITDQVERMSD